MVQFYACFNFFLCFGYDNIWWGLSNKLKGLTKINEPHHKMYNIIVKTAVFSRCRLNCTLWKFILGKARKKGLLTYTITPESLLLCHNGKVKFSLHTGNSAVYWLLYWYSWSFCPAWVLNSDDLFSHLCWWELYDVIFYSPLMSEFNAHHQKFYSICAVWYWTSTVQSTLS